jgi:hypothetical protein
MGSGSTAVAAVRTGRHYVGFDTDPGYVAHAEARVAAEEPPARPVQLAPVPAASAGADEVELDAIERAVREGRRAKDVAKLLLREAGFEQIRSGAKVAAGLEVTFRARDRAGNEWLFELAGGLSSANPGLRRSETLWRTLGKASVLAAASTKGEPPRLVLLTTELPGRGTPGARALAMVTGTTVADVIHLLDETDVKRLRTRAEAVVD